MKLVTFARDMRPNRKGDQRLVPDEMAQIMLESGDASHEENWPPEASNRPVPAARYVTKGFKRPKH